MNPFPYVFYSSAVLAAIAASMAVCVHSRTFRYAAAAALLGPLLITYLLGMYRVDGVDFGNYQSYMADLDRIPDIGFRLVMNFAKAIGLSLSEFFLLQALFSLCAIYLLARKLKSDLLVVFALYILHAAIARDFSQSRTALALAIYFLALAQDRKAFYAILTVAAVSVHLTLVPLVLVYHWARIVVESRKGGVLLAIAPALALLAGVSVLLPLVASLDPRVEIYMNWSQDRYGNPVGSYMALMLLVVIGAILYRAHQITGDRELQVFLVMIVYAAVIFIAFRHLAIFASRLSNVVAALYPFAVGRAITQLKNAKHDSLNDVTMFFGLLGALLVGVIFRPDNLDVLQETQPMLFVH